jgi:hypothetical protein
MRGSRTLIVVPLRPSLSARMKPPCAATIPAATASPSPASASPTGRGLLKPSFADSGCAMPTGQTDAVGEVADHGRDETKHHEASVLLTRRRGQTQ